MDEEVKEPVVLTKFENFCKLFPEFTFWPDQTRTPKESKQDERTLAQAVAQRERRKNRNLINGARGKYGKS
jgi:hypothetical protein